MKKMRLVALLALLPFYLLAQDPSIILTTQRPPELDVSSYRQVAVGQITGPYGEPTELSMDLMDALSTRLFAAKTLEVVDKEALDKILGEQRSKDLQVIDEATTRMLNRKLGNAILITGRMKSSPLEQKLIYSNQSVAVNGCATKYYYHVKGNVSVQLKIFDLRQGKLIYNEPVTIEVERQTKEDCVVPNKLDIPAITRQATKELGEEVAKMVVPYEVKTTLQFSSPGLFKPVFKRLREAIGLMQVNSNQSAIDILKEYTTSKEIKAKFTPAAYYNYSLALIYAGRYDEAKGALEKTMTGGNAYIKIVNDLTAFIEKEQQAAQSLARQTEQRQKMEQAALTKPDMQKEASSTSTGRPAGTKNTSKVKTKG